MTVDGIDCWTVEHAGKEFAQDSKRFSHKHKHAGMTHELGVSVKESRLTWMNGPFKSWDSDRKNFRNKGLRDKLLAIKKRGIADGGYTGHPKELSTPNSHDSKIVRMFKSRALKRHEKFNNKIKVYKAIKERFRHAEDGFAVCFEAICVLCQHDMENGAPLYNIYVGAMQFEN